MTEELQKVKEMYLSGMQYKDMAKAIGTTAKRMTSLVRLLIVTGEVEARHEWTKSKREIEAQDRLQQIIPLYESGMTYREIADKFELTYGTVYQQLTWAKTAGLCKEYVKPVAPPKPTHGPNGGVICCEAIRKKCRYGDDGVTMSMCNYLFITGEIRPCSGKDCTCFQERKPRRKKDVLPES